MIMAKMATFAITNKELLSSIKDGSISGLSLGSVSEDAMTKKYWFINKSIHYQDLNDMEEVVPLFISFVDKGANQYGLEIMDYNVYINKNDKTGENMSNEEKNEEPMIPISALGKLRDIFSINKREDEKEENNDDNKQGKKEPEEKPQKEDDISNKELLEKLPDALTESVKKAIGEAISNNETDTTPTKQDNKDDETKKEDENDSEGESSNDNKEGTKEDDETNKDVDINKRQTSMADNIVDESPSQDFYARTGRDHLGRKIRT